VICKKEELEVMHPANLSGFIAEWSEVHSSMCVGEICCFHLWFSNEA
jgi:hypothetical protein